jgi:hypothetical protein
MPDATGGAAGSFRIDVFHYAGDGPDLAQEIQNMSAAMDRLKTEVAETRGIIASAKVAFAGLGQQIRDLRDQVAKLDPAAVEQELTQMADDLDAAQGELAAGIQAVPPVQPGEVVPPPEQVTNAAGFPVAQPPEPAPEPAPTAPANVPVQPAPIEQPVAPDFDSMTKAQLTEWAEAHGHSFPTAMLREDMIAEAKRLWAP